MQLFSLRMGKFRNFYLFRSHPYKISSSYDVIITDTLDEIVKKFKQTGANILFGAEHYCWPDKTLEHLYPTVENGARFLNSGMFIGYAADIYEILKNPIKNTDDDQLFYSKAYLDTKVREKLNIKLDHKSLVFQNLHGSLSTLTTNYLPCNVSYLRLFI